MELYAEYNKKRNSYSHIDLYFGICHLSAESWTSWMGNTAALQRSGHIMNYIVYSLAFFSIYLLQFNIRNF